VEATFGSGSAVDVTVVTFNSALDLPDCLDTIPAGCNVTVIDNASRDASVEIAKTFGANVVRNDRNEGFGAAANHGARLGRAPYLLFLNPDARLRPTTLDRLVAASETPGVAVVGAALYGEDGSSQTSWYPVPSPANTWIQLLHLTRFGAGRPRLPDVPSVVGAVMLVRRDVFEALDGFDERFWLYGEETDFCKRCRDRGWRVQLVKDAQAVHLGGGSGVGINDVVFEHNQLAAELIVAKYHGAIGLLAYRVGVVLNALVHVLALGARGARSADRRRWWRRIGGRQWRLLLRSPTRPDLSVGDRLRSQTADA
jgi:N-acetylglucosaminyl-diphospho-decaprenol L-rhamnosyltransferase